MTGCSKGRQGFTHTGSIQWDSSWPELESPNKREEIFEYLEQRFGIPSATFDDYVLFKRKKGWWLMRKSSHLMEAGKLKIGYAGIKAFQKVGKYLKPTTRLIQCFGEQASKGIVELCVKEFASLVSGSGLKKDLALEDGYVILRLGKDVVLGVGLWTKGRLISQIPKRDLRVAMLRETV